MGKAKSVFRTNVSYGLLVLIPVGVIFLLLAKMTELLEKITTPLDLPPDIRIVAAMLTGFLLLFIFCFVVGALVRTNIGSWFHERIENRILKQIPGYEIISNILKGFAQKKIAYPAARIRLTAPGAEVLGFVMEKNNDGALTVFVPSAPAVTVGSLYIVDRERVTMLEAGSMEVTNCISQWGIGSSKILAPPDN